MQSITIADLRDQARKRLPRAVFDYIDGGAFDERALAGNRAAFDQLALLPRALRDISQRSQKTTVLGQEIAAPLILAPVGLSGLFAGAGEVQAARAAQEAGIPYCLSTASIASVDDVAAGTSAPFWFQLYVMRDKEVTASMVERARAAGCSVLCVTVDVTLQGPRERDIRNGFTIPPRVTARNFFDMMRRLPWMREVLWGRKINFGNFAPFAGGGNIMASAKFVASQFEDAITWDDIAWFRSMWKGPLVLKGVLSPEDARLAAEHGVDGLVVSNHGGRQLDSAPPALAALPEIVEAVGDRVEVLMDGGIRRGDDVVKALALGARACMIGRAYAWGLGASGQAGVARAISILKAEIDTTIGLLGVPEIGDLNASVLRPAGHRVTLPASAPRRPPLTDAAE
ncbi:MAG TPA: alpha-hydroxy-acid oxidizing protein [Paracoccus sp.]|nr:alpha-hydroxy-acid oxidizing protein [Paracoccus sp. (in: a-proteobacteria)]